MRSTEPRQALIARPGAVARLQRRCGRYSLDEAKAAFRGGRGVLRSDRLDARELCDLAPFLSFIGDELSKIGGRAWTHGTAKIGKLRLHRGVGEGGIKSYHHRHPPAERRLGLVASASEAVGHPAVGAVRPDRRLSWGEERFASCRAGHLRWAK